jgi:serine/threonine protein kinase
MASQEKESDQQVAAQSGTSERATSATRTKRRAGHILANGLRFGNYQIVRLIAVGGMSEVYEALHVGLRKRVALKVMQPDLVANPEARRCFVAEGVNAARIRHTHVVDVTDVGVFDDLPYLVMSLLEGEDLAAVYARRGRIPVSELVDLLLPVACAVAIGHSHGVVHRDLKPDNIFLHQEGSRVIPKVLDFGVSRLVGALRTARPSVFGTPYYMAPEQARGEACDTRADQYALGVILYQGLAGRLPRQSVDSADLLHVVAFGTPSLSPPSRHVTLPTELEAAVWRAVSHDPEDRFVSMRDLALALLPFATPKARQYWTEELRNLPNIGPAGRPVPPQPQRPALPPRSSVLSAPVLQIGQADTTEKLATLAAAPTPAMSLQMFASPQRAMAIVKREPTLPSKSLRAAYQQEAAPAAAQAKRPRNAKALGFAAAVLLLAAAGVLQVTSGSGTTSVSPATESVASDRNRTRYVDVDVQVKPSSAALLLDEKQVAIGHYKAHLPQDDTTHELRAAAAGFITRSIWFREEAPEHVIELAPVATSPTVTVAAPSQPAPHELAPKAPAVLHKPAPKTVVAAVVHPRALPKITAVALEQTSTGSAAPQSAHISVIEMQEARIRVVDEEQPRVLTIE